MKRTLLLSAIATAQLVAAVCAQAAADGPSGGEPRFRKVFAFTDIGDDEHAAKLAELNVFAANCCDAGNRPDPEKAVLESGAEYLAVHEIDSVVADPAVFAVFRKYCASPGREDGR